MHTITLLFVQAPVAPEDSKWICFTLSDNSYIIAIEAINKVELDILF